MNRFSNLSDRKGQHETGLQKEEDQYAGVAPSRIGRKAISGYFSPEMSFALHMCARRNGMSLQDLMAEAFDDVLRKYGESPIGS